MNDGHHEGDGTSKSGVHPRFLTLTFGWRDCSERPKAGV
jgi:hypothetical protein